MPEYVYALHDFSPEHDDELTFSAGERIEIVEKDDLYGDGWWQGRNLLGKIGLFPQAYTTPSQPGFVEARTLTNTGTALQSLQEHPEEYMSHSNGSGVMADTLTDVQAAIEQLGTNGKDRDADGRSFSFASSVGDLTDKEHTDTEGDVDGDVDRHDGRRGGNAAVEDPDEWHKGARRLLAANAAREMEKRRSEERTYAAATTTPPPIDLVMSDESESEPEDGEQADQYGHTRQFGHSHGHNKSLSLSSRGGGFGTPTVMEEPERENDRLGDDMHRNFARNSGGASVSSLPTPTSPHTALPNVSQQSSMTGPVLKVVNADLDRKDGSDRDGANGTPQPNNPPGLPSPAPSSAAGSGSGSNKSTGALALGRPITPPSTFPPQTPNSAKFGGWGTATILNGTSRSTSSSGVVGQPTIPEEPVQSPGSMADDEGGTTKSSKTHPSEWSVEQVVDWLKGKGFDDSVCDAFIENDITGDILLDLDAGSLKSELGINAFGKRKRIENAILDLRRPSSISSSFSPPAITHSQEVSLNSPGVAYGYAIGTPSAMSGMMSPESPPHTGDIAGTPMSGTMSDRGRVAATSGTGMSRIVSDPARGSDNVGLGIGDSQTWGKNKSKPANLNLKPATSDSQLNKQAVGESDTADSPYHTELVNDLRSLDYDKMERSAFSDAEAVPAISPKEARKQRRRVFGKSVDSNKSAGSSTRESRDMGNPAPHPSGASSLPGSPFASAAGTVVRRPNADSINTNPTARSSFFSIGSIGSKNNKKGTVRGSTYSDDANPSSLSRLISSGSNKRAPGRPTTPHGRKDSLTSTTVVGSINEKGSNGSNSARDTAVLRKKGTPNASAGDLRSEPSFGNLRNENRISQGAGGKAVSILQQIGKPDHAGFLRKKGERYNSWKVRYLVLKGPHLYYLRSDKDTETKIKGYINIQGYKVLADENVNPGRYGFRIIHDSEKPHYFSSEEQIAVRDWMKALMKATIGRDYTKPVVSSCNIPTIPLTVAQAMNPAPRPPSPGARDATQKALRRENTSQLSTRDAQVLMNFPTNGSNGAGEVLPDRADVQSMYSTLGSATPTTPAPPRPNRDRVSRATSNSSNTVRKSNSELNTDPELIEWANEHLPWQLQFQQGMTSYGLAILRLAENIRGKPFEPPIRDEAFPSGPNDERLDGFFRLFDVLLDEGVQIGTASINEVRQGKPERITQLLRALRVWEAKRAGKTGGGGYVI